jgi:hypothetical protein
MEIFSTAASSEGNSLERLLLPTMTSISEELPLEKRCTVHH